VADAFRETVLVAELIYAKEVFDLIFPIGRRVLVALHAATADHDRIWREVAAHAFVETRFGDAIEVGERAADLHAPTLELLDQLAEPSFHILLATTPLLHHGAPLIEQGRIEAEALNLALVFS